jgi:predicted HTH transcriptional regulator
MDDRELELLLDDLESDRVERKASLNNKDRICEAICAFANDLPFDLYPQSSASIDDLDRDLFYRTYLPRTLSSEIIAQNHRTFEQQLMALRFLNGEPPFKPTKLGILVIGKKPRYFIPNAYVQFIRFDGIEMIDPVQEQEEINGPLPDLVKDIDYTPFPKFALVTGIA